MFSDIDGDEIKGIQCVKVIWRAKLTVRLGVGGTETSSSAGDGRKEKEAF